MSGDRAGRVPAGDARGGSPRFGVDALIDTGTAVPAGEVGDDFARGRGDGGGRLRRDLHWWLGAVLVVLALPLLAWQALHRDARDRDAREGDAARREIAQVRPPETTTALERTIREQAEAVQSSPVPPPAVPPLPPLPTLATLPSRAGLPAAAGLPAPGAVEPITPSVDAEAARRQRLADETERRLADALGSPILAIGGAGGLRASGTAGGAGGFPLASPVAPLAGGLGRMAVPLPSAAGDAAAAADVARAFSGLQKTEAGGRATDGVRAFTDRQWLEQWQPPTGDRPGAPVAPLSVRPSPGSRVVLQGTILPAVLLTEINSDLPGSLAAKVTQDVWDSIDSRFLLIPKGTRLVGAYNADVRPGQQRVLAAFTRLILPGGESIDLLGMQAADAQGRSGLADQVDRHFWQMFGASFVIAGLASLVQQRENPESTVVVVPGGASGTGAALSSAAGTVLVDTARTVLGRNRTIPPTLVIRQGHRFVLTVQRDFLVPEKEDGIMSSRSR